MPKILMLISSCGGCPNYGYYSGGQYRCNLVDENVEDKTTIAAFCPLSDFPSRTLANMDMTIRLLREPNKYGLGVTLISHLATKFKTPMSRDGAIHIALKDGTSVYVRYDSITEVLAHQGSVVIVNENGRFKLVPDAVPPQLFQEIKREGITDELWKKLDIAV